MYGTSNLIAFAATYRPRHGTDWSRKLLSNLFQWIDRNPEEETSLRDNDLLEILWGNGAFVLMFLGYMRLNRTEQMDLLAREREGNGIPLDLLLQCLFGAHLPEDISAAMTEERFSELSELITQHMAQAHIPWNEAWLAPVPTRPAP